MVFVATGYFGLLCVCILMVQQNTGPCVTLHSQACKYVEEANVEVIEVNLALELVLYMCSY